MMRKSPSPKLALAAIAASIVMLLFGSAYRVLAARYGAPLSTTPIAPDALAVVPMQIGQWVGHDVPLDDLIVRRTVTDAHINRRYSRGNGLDSVSLYVACGVSTAELIAHCPEVCYPTSGWMPMDRSSVELPLNDGTTLPCTIFQFSRGAVDVQRVTVLHYFIVRGEPCREVPLLLRSRIRRAFSILDCVAQVQIVVSSTKALSTNSATELARAFAADSASEITRLFRQVEGDMKIDKLHPTEAQDKEQ